MSGSDGEVVIKGFRSGDGFHPQHEYAIEDDDDGTEPVIWEHRIDIEKSKGIIRLASTTAP
jgi:hypothetical protein